MIVYPFQTIYVSVTAFHITVLNYLCQLIHKLFAISFIDVASFVTTVLVASDFTCTLEVIPVPPSNLPQHNKFFQIPVQPAPKFKKAEQRRS